MTFQYDSSKAGVVTLKTPAVITLNYTFTWPSTVGTAGYILQTTWTGAGSWVAVSTTTTGFTFALNISGTNATTNVTSITASGGTANQSLTLKGPSYTSGYFSLTKPTNSLAGGATRGTQSVDFTFPVDRTVTTNVVSGQYSVCASYDSKVAGIACADLGGFGNLQDTGVTYAFALGLTNAPNSAQPHYGLSLGTDSPTNYTTLTGGKFSTFICGKGPSTNSPYTWAQGGGGGAGFQSGLINKYAQNGWVQGSQLCLYARTTDGTTKVYPTAEGNYVSAYGPLVNVSQQGAFLMYVYAVANLTQGTSGAALIAYGGYSRGGSGANGKLIGTATSSVLFADAALTGLTMTLEAGPSTSNAYFYPYVIGLAAKTINWTFTVYIVTNAYA